MAFMLSVNVTSEVRSFTTLDGRRVYVLDGEWGFDLDALIAACNSRACAPPPVGTGGSISQGGAAPKPPKRTKLPLGANPEKWAKKVLANRKKNATDPLPAYMPPIHSGWSKFPKSPVVRIRIPSNVLGSILNDGRLKAQGETGTSMGMLSPNFRRTKEQNMFDLSEDPKLVYGYLGEEGGGNPFSGKYQMLRQYGDVIIELKPSVLDRTTTTMGDSLLYKTTEVAPIRVGDVSSSTDTRLFTASEEYERYSPPYFEAQVHGGVSIDDIARIYITESKTVPDDDTISRLIHEFPDIELVFLDEPTHESFGVCTDCGEFACNSRACAPPPVGRGGSLPSGSGSSLPNGADPEPYAQALIKRWREAGILEDGIKDRKRAWDTRIPKDPVVRMRIGVNQLDLVLHDDGVFKSQHETGSSGGYFGPETRERRESEMFSAANTRPKYGYLAERDQPSRNSKSLSFYGDITVEFKDEVAKRTTFTVGDSLSSGLAAMRVSDAHTSTVERMAATLQSGGSYIEAQIHGNLTMNDVVRIYVTKRDYYDIDYESRYYKDEPSPVIRQLAEKYPDIEIVITDDPMTVSFSACEEHGEFECKSRACAPPPVGRGGSLPSGGSGKFSPRNGADPEPFAREKISELMGQSSESYEDDVRESESEWKLRMPKNPVVRVRVPSSSLRGIARSGRLKTQHETGTSEGTLHPELRAEDEKRLYGEGLRGHPLYGYLAKRGSTTTYSDGLSDSIYGERSSASQYGEVIIELKPFVHNRVTVTLGDSFENDVAPIPLVDVWKVSPERRAVARSSERYVEAQIHQQVQMSRDVARIYVPSGAQDDDGRPLVETVKGLFPDIEVIELPAWPKYVSNEFSACEAHGEFACKSRSCAPPPIGTGGSLPTSATHVTTREAAASIKSGGFIVGTGKMHGNLFGNGVYLSYAGDKKATKFYQAATRWERKEAALVRATVRLKNPLKIEGSTLDQITKDMVKKMGGQNAVSDAARNVLRRKISASRKALGDVLGEDAMKRVDWDGDYDLDPVFDEMSRNQYQDYQSRVSDALKGEPWVADLTPKMLRRAIDGEHKRSMKTLATLAREFGFDGIEVTNEPFNEGVGGSQIVVFDPRAITVESVEDFTALVTGFGIEVSFERPVACTDCGEFACKSRACAPPPVGRGGSLPSVAGRPAHETKGWELGAYRLVRSMSDSIGIGDVMKGSELAGDRTEEVIELQTAWGSDSNRISAKIRSNMMIRERLLDDPEFIDGVGKLLDTVEVDFIDISTRNMDEDDVYDPRVAILNLLSRHIGIGHVFPLSQQFNEIVDDLGITAPDPSLRDIIESFQESSSDYTEDGSARVGDLTPEQFAGYAVVAAMIDSWADTSMGTPLSIAYQLAASKLHGVDAEKFISEYRDPSNENRLIDGDILREGRHFFSENQGLLVSMARAEYEATQEFLRKNGIKEITVYRGIKLVDPIESNGKLADVGDTVLTTSNVLSSWSIDPRMGKQFAEELETKLGFTNRPRTHGYVIAMTVPVEMVQAIPTSGRGCLNEYEAIIIGHPSEVGIIEYLPKGETLVSSGFGVFVAVH
jgi:hypothetical protein